MKFQRLSMSLRTYSALIFASVIILISVFISLNIGTRTTRVVTDDVGDALAQTAYHMADKMDTFMWARSGELYTLSQLEGLSEMDASGQRRLLDSLKSNFPMFSWIGITNAKGQVRAATDGILESVDISQRPVYIEGSQGKFIGDVHEAVLLKKLLPNPTGEDMKFVDISLPLTDQRGEFKGVLAAHLSWTWANTVQKAIMTPLRQDHAMDMLVLSANDHVILLGPSDRLGETFELPAYLNLSPGSKGYFEAAAGGQKYLMGYSVSDGNLDYEGLGWIIVVRQPLSTAYQEVYLLQRNILLIGSLSALLFSLLVFFLSSHIAKPLTEIVRATELIRFGENLDIPKHKGIRETELLSDALQNLINNLAHTSGALNAMSVKANSDPLTGLPNRLGMKNFFEELASQGNLPILSVLCMDLDGFKGVNDRYGHAAGDYVLIEVSKRLRQIIRKEELVSRVGGDEFTLVLLHDSTGTDKGHQIASRIIEAINQPIDFEGKSLHVGCSIGGTFLQQGEDVSEAANRADQALYASKTAGKNRYTFMA